MIEESTYQLRSKKQLLDHYKQKQVEKVQDRITERVILYSAPKALKQTNLIMGALKNHFIFYNLSEAQLENIKDKMLCCEVNENQQIFRDNDEGSCFFIVNQGLLRMNEGQGTIPRDLKPSDGFGEIALLYQTQRNSTVTAIQKSRLWVIDRIAFREAVEQIIVKEYNENRKYLESVRFFSQLSYDQKDLVASTLIVQKFYKNQNIIQEGDPGSSLYYVKEGVASVYKGDKFVRKLSRGDSFGEQSLYYNTMRQYTIKADDEVTCLVLGRDTLNRILGDKIYDVTFKNFIKWAFDKNSTLSRLSKEHIQKIIDNMKISSLKAHQTIFKRGISGFQKIIVVIEGSLKKLKNGAVVASKGQCYGEQYLTNQYKTKILEDEIVMSTYGVIAQINSNNFYQQIDSYSLEDVISKNDGNKKKQQALENSELFINASKFQLKDFLYSDKIADGQFGEVLKVKDPHSNFYCVKAFQKNELQSYDVQKFIRQQKVVASILNHPFILKTVKSFQSQKQLFFMNEFINGINFYDVLKQIGLLSSQDCQFYCANIITILEYLQSKCVISRDIKPENFMVTDRGYLKLINLSTAKLSQTQGNQMMKTFTVIGTPHYMAPDIVLGKGYDNMIDLWSLGVCMYQFFTGVLPFGDAANSSYEIYQEILQVEVKFPEFMTDKKAKKLIEQLLSHNPEQRNGGSFSNLKSNPFFQNIDWTEFLQMNLGKAPPFIPNLKRQENIQRSINSKKLLIQYLKESDKRLNTYHPKKDIWTDFGQSID